MTNAQTPMTNDGSRTDTPPSSTGPATSAGNRVFDLVERSAKLGEAVIRFVRRIKMDAVTKPLIQQLVRSATSVGANYCEADEAGTTKEFRYRISLCNREVRETKHWLRMLAVAVPEHKEQARLLWKESNELNLIFSSIFHKTKPNG